MAWSMVHPFVWVSPQPIAKRKIAERLRWKVAASSSIVANVDASSRAWCRTL